MNNKGYTGILEYAPENVYTNEPDTCKVMLRLRAQNDEQARIAIAEYFKSNLGNTVSRILSIWVVPTGEICVMEQGDE